MTLAWAVLVAVGFLADVVFVTLYLRSPGWHRSEVGRNLMAMAVVMAGLLGLSLVGMFWRPPAWAWLGGMASLDAVLWWRVLLLWRAQHQR